MRGYGGSTYDGACVFLLFPLLVWLGAEAVQSDRVRTAGTLAGYLSYPVYLLQAPLGTIMNAVAHHLGGNTAHNMPVRVIAYVAVTVLGSWVIAQLYDSPVREWLSRRYLRGAPRPPAQTAP